MRRRDKARENGKLLTGRVPGWLEMKNGEIVPLPERVAARKRLFALSGAGSGKSRIIRTLITPTIVPFGNSGKWTVPYLARILNDSCVLGELQPRKTDDPDAAWAPTHAPAASGGVRVEDERVELRKAGESPYRPSAKKWTRLHREPMLPSLVLM